MNEEGKKLTPKQERFCEEFLTDLNATQAAYRAGYSEDTAGSQGHDLLKKPEIQTKIAELRAKLSAKTELTQEWVLNRFKDISNRCMQAEPVMIFQDGEWVESGEYKFDSNGANKATEMIGKHIGFFEEHNKQKSSVKTIEVVWGKKPKEEDGD